VQAADRSANSPRDRQRQIPWKNNIQPTAEQPRNVVAKKQKAQQDGIDPSRERFHNFIVPDISLQNRIEMRQRKSEDEQSSSSNQEAIFFHRTSLKNDYKFTKIVAANLQQKATKLYYTNYNLSRVIGIDAHILIR
tara:strand:+ start:59 stop:466 length:408 start_codon:yes stop_codon:yes gene_type:complete